jgi:hypothetical protein
MIGDKDVDTPVKAHRFIDQLLFITGAVKIGLNSMAATGTTLGDELFGRFPGTLVIEDDLSAGFREEAHTGCADSARASGDNGYFVLNGKCHWHTGQIIEPWERLARLEQMKTRGESGTSQSLIGQNLRNATPPRFSGESLEIWSLRIFIESI